MAVATAAAVVSTAGTVYAAHQSNKAGKRQGRAMDSEMAMRQQQIDLQQEHLGWAKGLYEDWRQEFDPILTEMKMEAMAGRTPDYAAIAADVTQAFGSARNQQQRGLERYGIKPGDGQWGANERRMGIGEASAEVGARQQARRENQDQRFGRLGMVYGIGAQQMGQAAGMVSGGVAGLSNAFGGAAQSHANQAGIHGQQAGQFGQMAAGMGAQAFDSWAGILNQAAGPSSNPSAYGGGPNSFYGIQAPTGTTGTAPWRAPGGG